MMERFDVVTVPDFLGPRSHVYEVRTLFFLASWLENAGKARNFPLHVACIGKPPGSVEWLASACEAVVTVHTPYETGAFWNKFRGLEIQGREERVLLLDTDTIFCGDISGLGEFGQCIAVAPRGLPGISESYWELIYKALGMDPPTERIASMVGELDCPLPKGAVQSGQYSSYKAMTPCYNGGVIFAPWRCGLRDLWEEHLLTISSRKDAIGQSVEKDDQHCLATAIEVLKRRGLPVRRLPREYNADLTYIFRGAVRSRDIKILHAIGLFASSSKDKTNIRHEIAAFLGEELRSVARDLLRTDIDSSQRARILRYLLPSARKALYLRVMLNRLHQKHVQQALRHS
jgi:hypothetical protein